MKGIASGDIKEGACTIESDTYLAYDTFDFYHAFCLLFFALLRVEWKYKLVCIGIRVCNTLLVWSEKSCRCVSAILFPSLLNRKLLFPSHQHSKYIISVEMDGDGLTMRSLFSRPSKRF